MPINRTRIETLRGFISNNDGCVPSSEWTNGAGRYTTKKAPPPHCELMTIQQAMRLPGLSGRAAKRLHRNRPSIQKVVVVTNQRAVNTLLAGGE